MKRINKVDTRLQKTGYGWAALAMALPLTGFGVYFALAGFGVVPLAGKANAPLWVIGCVGLAFTMGAVLLAGYSLQALWHRRRAAGLRGRRLHEPWFKDYPWDPSGIHDTARTRWINSFVGVVLLTTFLVPFNWWAFLSREGPLMVKIITGVFDLVVVLVFVSLLYRLAQYFKYGRSTLAFAHFPFAPGEPLRVYLHSSYVGEMEATLRFVEERFETSGHGKNRRTSHRVYEHYSEAQILTTEANDAGVPIEFELPDNKQWVDQLTADPAVRYWELLLGATTPGINFRTTFLLPVYDRPRGQATAFPSRRWRTRPARRRIPYGFELGLPLMIVSLAWLTWHFAPQTTRDRSIDAVQALSSALQGVWRLVPVEGIGSSAMAAAVGPDGRVWVLTKYSLDRFAQGERDTLLDTKRYRALFGSKVNALSSLLVTGSDEAWLGSWYGELFHYQQGSWRRLSRRGEPLAVRITGLAELDNRLYAATRDGLWMRVSDNEGLRRIEVVPRGQVAAIIRADWGELCAGINAGLWCRAGGSWAQRWQSPAAITALLPEPDGTWLVGTEDGLYTLELERGVIDHQLPGRQITRLVREGESLWVATWNDGLLRRVNRQWTARKTGSLSDLAIDPHGGLWLAVYGEGLINTSTQVMAGLLRGPGAALER